MRWATVLALWGMLVAAWVVPAPGLPLRSVSLLVFAAAICRTVAAVLARWPRGVPRVVTGAVLLADAGLLTGLLDITGGPFNPFVVVYGVYVWTAAVVLSPAWAALTGLLSTAAFGWLVADHVQHGALPHHRLDDLPTHLFTMWFAGAAVAELVDHYVGRSRAALAQRQQALDIARDRAARSERLAALTTLAAGAAHELSTPLATIAVAARELERGASKLAASGDGVAGGISDDARLIRMEVDRCQAILDGMSGRASRWAAASVEPLSASDLVRIVRGRLTEDQNRRLRQELSASGVLEEHGAEVAQAVTSLLKNAFDASPPGAGVVMRVDRRNGLLRFEVYDRGPGMSDEVKRRIGEPFFTTKDAGRGFGLGVFLARTIAERAGGSLAFSDGPGGGTMAALEVPAPAREVVEA